jgi:hypothetical protein
MNYRKVIVIGHATKKKKNCLLCSMEAERLKKCNQTLTKKAQQTKDEIVLVK